MAWKGTSRWVHAQDRHVKYAISCFRAGAVLKNWTKGETLTKGGGGVVRRGEVVRVPRPRTRYNVGTAAGAGQTGDLQVVADEVTGWEKVARSLVPPFWFKFVASGRYVVWLLFLRTPQVGRYLPPT